MSRRTVTDETILAGFRDLHAAMAGGFDVVRAEMNARFEQVEGRFGTLEARMMRRFDAVEERFDAMERRITALERRR